MSASVINHVCSIPGCFQLAALRITTAATADKPTFSCLRHVPQECERHDLKGPWKLEAMFSLCAPIELDEPKSAHVDGVAIKLSQYPRTQIVIQLAQKSDEEVLELLQAGVRNSLFKFVTECANELELRKSEPKSPVPKTRYM